MQNIISHFHKNRRKEKERKKVFYSFKVQGLICPPFQEFERPYALDFYWWLKYILIFQLLTFMHKCEKRSDWCMMAYFQWVMASQKLFLKRITAAQVAHCLPAIERTLKGCFTVSVWYCAVIKELKQASMPKELIDKRFHD